MVGFANLILRLDELTRAAHSACCARVKLYDDIICSIRNVSTRCLTPRTRSRAPNSSDKSSSAEHDLVRPHPRFAPPLPSPALHLRCDPLRRGERGWGSTVRRQAHKKAQPRPCGTRLSKPKGKGGETFGDGSDLRPLAH